MPVVVLLVFKVRPSAGHGGIPGHLPFVDWEFPLGAAYALLMLSNPIYNSFGADGAGTQLFFVAPVRFREIMLAKNLTHAAVLVIEILFVWTAVCLMFHPPSANLFLATIAGVTFLAIVNFAVGDFMSLYSPKKFDYAALGRQRAAGLTVLASMGVQICGFGLVGLALITTSSRGRIWMATLILLVFAAIAFAGYWAVLARVDRVALDRRESILAALAKS
jgi:ABC-2 type transport system permease protein